MKFFNIDFHISVVADLQQIFRKLGHEFDDWCLSGHNWVLNKTKAHVPLLNGWEKMIEKQLWNEFADTYPELEQYDAFVCTYPPAFAMLYQNFNKPVIIQIPIRYEYPYTFNQANWEYFNEFLRNGIDKKKVIPVCNSLFEKEYFDSYVGRPAKYIPNLCEYTGMQYSPDAPPVIYGHNNHGLQFPTRSDLGVFRWQDLAKRRSIIHFPYQTSTMSIFEQYTANIPLIFPSQKYIRSHLEMLSQVLWSRTCGQKATPPKCNIDWEDDWPVFLHLADYYQWPHIQYFDSLEHCREIVGNVDEGDIYHAMKEENFHRKQRVYRDWEEILSSILDYLIY